MIDGTVQKHINLKPEEPVTVEFASGLTQLSIVNMGDAEVYFKLDDITFSTIHDETSNYLNDLVRTVDIDKNDAFTTVTFVASGVTSVQWDYR